MDSFEALKILGVPRSTLYRWRKRLEGFGPKGLEDRSRRPKRVRKRGWSPELILAIKELRGMFPSWGKEKIWVLLRRLGFETSVWTARDVVSGWNVLEVFCSASSCCGRRFLRAMFSRVPFRVKAIKVDGGSEFYGEFERECQERGVRLYVVRPRSPEEQGHVERAQGIHRYEFYESYDLPLDLRELRQVVREWEWICNFLRPSRPLGGKTPWEYLMENHREAVSFDAKLSHMIP